MSRSGIHFGTTFGPRGGQGRRDGSGGNSGGGPDPGRQFRLAVLGDFSGRASRGLRESPDALANRMPLRIDADNFEAVMQKLGVVLQLPFGQGAGDLHLHFAGLDDFHPDRLAQQVGALSALKRTYERLSDPSTFAAAAADLQALVNLPAGDTPAAAAAPPGGAAARAGRPALDRAALPPSPSGGADQPAESDEEGLARILEGGASVPAPLPARRAAGGTGGGGAGDPGGASAAGQKAPSAVDSFLESLIADSLRAHVRPQSHPRQQEMLALVDTALASLLRAVLHQRDFQALEAAWRSVHFLVSRLNTDDELKIFLIDVTKEELAADAGADATAGGDGTPGEAATSDSAEGSAGGDPTASGLYRLLVDKTVNTPGAPRWALLVGHYEFGPDPADATLLDRLGRVAEAAGAPLIAGAAADLVGTPSFALEADPRRWQPHLPPAWHELRRAPHAPFLALAAPRFLLRLPYGKLTDAIEMFPFEEFPPGPSLADDGRRLMRHESYLWGNGAFACAYLLADRFLAEGWEMDGGAGGDVDDLPVHASRVDGESEMQPCAEALLTGTAGDAVMSQGIIPLLSLKDRGAARVARIQSLALPPAALAGRWG